MTLVHLPGTSGGATRWAVRRSSGGAATDVPLTTTLAELLALPLDSAREVVEAAAERGGDGVAAQGAVLAPVDR